MSIKTTSHLLQSAKETIVGSRRCYAKPAKSSFALSMFFPKPVRTQVSAESSRHRWSTSVHLRPSSPFTSLALSPPTRAWMRGPVVITNARAISSALGPSATPISIASKWLRT
jgi:hypothetical protein